MEETNEKEKQEVSENEVIINATDKKDKQDVPENELITRIKKCLLDLYCPADNINETEFHLSSSEVYEKLISIFPYSNEFTINSVNIWLHELGYKFNDFGEMRFEWLFKRNA